ncbi:MULTISPECIES: alpha/beta hydrolase [unclassified Mucilaginibacter]|uniref:alpha/beta fold hydrolase n=1 Tax=unclassified Mucilaginibacter TaxID=2617802 RepID=UPI002AC9811B|nr:MULTISPECIES: alpha/beta hydrolase [unclassified Mucilaginibacter]MEB0248888.1 alpha/beta hydrolase [Mucilaginibacter sp. 5B2]MEB0260900.1 alpha/beta hydrolase [Mucilaginibacter sp. 10I4]MEB0279865.1 alpha/beta hydrolase [Mucilaginibacter sp. 10B2]MEB0302456.1 alpha/beta hydrolase [Mucilaginibacter sp. 5C4]WPX24164.1 alpha/beta hydrolase [Mucilaginibacter sp. 5C4]
MKKLKRIVQDVKTLVTENMPNELNTLLWQLICYPPKMPLRLQQEQLLAKAEKFSVIVDDPYFTNQRLQVNCFKWGNGSTRVLISHGWGSKAMDFDGLINALKENPNLQIIAFDAPANGSSEGDLSNLLLFANAVKAVIAAKGEPDIAIGHSFGTMANVSALTDLCITPKLLISIAPFILLQENFIRSMTAVGVPADAQQAFLDDFKSRYGIYPSEYAMQKLYKFDDTLNHWLAYDELDTMLPDASLQAFLQAHPSIKTQNYSGAGHERIIKSAELIADVADKINEVL